MPQFSFVPLFSPIFLQSGLPSFNFGTWPNKERIFFNQVPIFFNFSMIYRIGHSNAEIGVCSTLFCLKKHIGHLTVRQWHKTCRRYNQVPIFSILVSYIVLETLMLKLGSSILYCFKKKIRYSHGNLWKKYVAPQNIFIDISDHFINTESEKLMKIGKQISNINKIKSRDFKTLISEKVLISSR